MMKKKLALTVAIAAGVGLASVGTTSNHINHNNTNNNHNNILQSTTGNTDQSSKNIDLLVAPSHKNVSTNIQLTGEVNSPIGLWLLNGPSMQGSKIQVMPNGAQFKILGHSGHWTKVDYNGQIGYCYTEYTKTLADNANSIIGTTSITSPVGLWMLGSPSMQGSQIQVIPYQSKVDVLGQSNGWLKVSYKGQIGWSYAKYTTGIALSKNPTPVNQSNKTTVKQKETTTSANYGTINSGVGLWMLNSPSMQGGKIKVIPYGAKVKLLGQSGSWTKVEYNGQIGYSYTEYITSSASNSQSSNKTTVKQKETAPTANYGSINSDIGLWMLNSPSMQGGKIKVLPYGTTVKLLGQYGNWTKIEYNGQVGYSYTEYITPVQSSTTVNNAITGAPIGHTRVSSPVGLWLLKSPSMHGKTIEVIPSNQSLSVYEIHNGWYKVAYNGQVGWVDSQYTNFLSKNQSGILRANLPQGQSLKFYSSPSTSSSVAGEISYLTSFAENGYTSNGWVKINYNGVNGYVQSIYTIGENSSYAESISSNAAHVKSSMSNNSKTILTLNKGTKVLVTMQSNHYSQIIVNGVSGYVLNSDLN